MNRDFELSNYQQDIMDYVKLNNGNLLIDAKAGSGKTSTLLLIADEILEHSNGSCLFLSFNKSIVEELQMKLPSMASSIKTVHSLGMTFIRSYLYKKHNTNYDLQVDTGKLRALVKNYYELYFQPRVVAYCQEIMGEDDIKELNTNLINDFVTICTFTRLYGNDYTNAKQVDYIRNRFCRYLHEYIDDVLPNYQDLVVAVLNKTIDMFEHPAETTTDGKPIYVIDYVDMIYFPIYFNMGIPYSLRNSLDTVMIDETQDLSQLQQLFVRKLNTGFNRFIFVGDRNQCQPKGTKVLMADLTEKNIEDITVGDMVVSYDTEAGYFRKQTKQCMGNMVLDTKKLKTDGYYNIILANGNQSNYTYNHKCYAKFNTTVGYVTYIMGAEDGKFRVGYTKLFHNNSSKNGGFGLRMRMRQEKCKYGWVINYHKNRYDAFMEEQLISVKYQIPQCIFNDGNNHRIPRFNINQFYKILGYDYVKQNVIKCLSDYGRNIEYPFVTVGDFKHHISKNHISIYEACNLIPEVMDCAYFNYDNKKRHYKYNCEVIGISFSKIKLIKYINDNCDVYCLKVDRDENYVADNILTHNCIYGFNGADTEAVDRIKYNFSPKELPLSICYRCPEKIVRLAQRNVPSIEWDPDRLDKGVLDTVNYEKMKYDIRPGEVIIGRKNRDLLQIYRDFVLKEKRPIKFKNRDMVNAINRDIASCVKDYLKLYAKHQNIDRVVKEHMEQYTAETGNNSKSPLYKGEMDIFIKEYIKEHKEDFKNKKIMKSNHTLDYLVTCMEEYKSDGAYEYEEDNILTEYYETILEFMEEYKKRHSSVLVKDFLDYIESFLTASLDQYNVPIIGSIHSMKGGEADTIYIYDYPRFPYMWKDMTKEDIQQEENLQYVAITRAKKNLHLITLDLDKAKDNNQREKMAEMNSDVICIVDSINKIVDAK